MKMLNRHTEELMEKPLTVFLMNGFQMHGTITGIYEEGIVLHANGKNNYIMLHAISTIVIE